MKPVWVPREDEYDPPSVAKIFCGFIYVPDLDLEEILRLLEQVWGPVDCISRRFSFGTTRYYGREMGSPLSRKFVTFREDVDQEALPRLKWEARRVERAWLGPTGGRRVNIDPGFLLPERLVLATTKPFAHRPYLGQGIYADVTLIYRKKSFRPMDWTYPDYTAPHILMMVNRMREHYLLQKRAARRGCIE